MGERVVGKQGPECESDSSIIRGRFPQIRVGDPRVNFSLSRRVFFNSQRFEKGKIVRRHFQPCPALCQQSVATLPHALLLCKHTLCVWVSAYVCVEEGDALARVAMEGLFELELWSAEPLIELWRQNQPV